MTDTPDHGCTIGGRPAMPILIAEYNQLVARAAELEAALARVRKVIDERRTEVAEREADGMLPFGTPGASWCDAVTVTCARVEDALRTSAEPVITVHAALHHSAETTVSRLYERWVKAGPPPLGTSINRWWDMRLAELHDAIQPAESATPFVDRPFRTHRQPKEQP